MLRSFYKILFLSALLLNFVNMSFAMSGGMKEKVFPPKVSENQLPEDGYVSSFDISPDGQEIVCTVNYKCSLDVYLKSDIWKMAIDGTNLRRLTYTGEDPVNKKAVAISKQGYKARDAAPDRTVGAERPEFSGKGNFILYTLKRTDYFMGEKRSDQPMIMNRDGSQQRKIKRCIFSPDETKYALFIESDYKLRQYALAIFDAKTDKILAEIPNIYEAGFIDTRLQKRIFWSPDSKKIAFTGCKEPEEPKENHMPPVYLWLVDGDNLKELTWAAAGFNTLAWSPDAQKIMIGSGGREVLYGSDIDHRKASGIWILDLENKREYKVSRDLRASSGRWSRDGKNVLFRGGGTLSNMDAKVKSAFYVASYDATNLTLLKEQNGLAYSFVCDDKYILYSSNYRSPSPSVEVYRELWLLSLDTKIDKKIVEKVDAMQTSAGGYQWVEKKKGIIYISQNNLWFMDTGTLIPKQLTNLIRENR